MADLSGVPGALPWAHPTDLRTLVNICPAGVLVTNGQGTVLFMNPAAEEWIGMPAGEASGRTLEMAFRDGRLVVEAPHGQIMESPARRQELMWEGNYAEAYFLDGAQPQETTVTEALLMARSAEERAVAAEDQLRESEDRALKAQNAAARIEVDLGQTRLELAQVQGRVELAEQRLEDAELRAREAEQGSAESAALLRRLQESEAALERAQGELEEQGQKLLDTEEQARHAVSRAERAEKELRYAGGWSPWGYEGPPDARSSRPTDEELARAANGLLGGAAPELLEEAQQRALEAEQRAVEAEERARAAEEKLIAPGETPDVLEEARERVRQAEEKARAIEIQAIEAEQRSMDATQMIESLEARLLESRHRAAEAEERARRAEEERSESLRQQAAPDQQEVLAAAERRVARAEERARKLEQPLQEALAQVRDLEDKLRQQQPPAGATTDKETQRLAFEDQLTRLPNLNILRQYLEVTSERVARGEGVAALLLIDLDRFRVLNDTLGHKAGDELLVQVASRLRSLLGNEAVLGRKGEDEFLAVVYIPGGDPEQCVARARGLSHRVMASLAEPLVVQGETVHLSASIGISFYPGDAEGSLELFEHADSAMYRAKELGRGRAQFFTTELLNAQKRRMTLEKQLRVALEQEQFTLLYQPIVDLTSGRMAGVEAFLRWEHPETGLVETGEFLDVAEESGLIVPIGDWVIHEACLQARVMKRKFVSINLSPRQLLQAGFVRRFMKWVEKAGIRADEIVVEVSEAISSVDPERIETVLHELAHWGVGLGIDDFGTGASSLRQLKKVGARFIKIDHKLVGALPNDRQAASICLAVVGLTRSLGVSSLAEGVETEEQRIYMKQYGCQLAQGRHFSPPLPGRDVVQLLKHRWKV
ncbi:MAG: EAL domain-containing protein [Armatimonadetes bacterium]|nr:EAL domain-containing protein [Armatimonadota bacterium]